MRKIKKTTKLFHHYALRLCVKCKRLCFVCTVYVGQYDLSFLIKCAVVNRKKCARIINIGVESIWNLVSLLLLLFVLFLGCCFICMSMMVFSWRWLKLFCVMRHVYVPVNTKNIGTHIHFVFFIYLCFSSILSYIFFASSLFINGNPELSSSPFISHLDFSHSCIFSSLMMI